MRNERGLGTTGLWIMSNTSLSKNIFVLVLGCIETVFCKSIIASHFAGFSRSIKYDMICTLLHHSRRIFHQQNHIQFWNSLFVFYCQHHVFLTQIDETCRNCTTLWESLFIKAEFGMLREKWKLSLRETVNKLIDLESCITLTSTWFFTSSTGF